LGLSRLLTTGSQDQDQFLAITVDLHWMVLVDLPEIPLLETLLAQGLNLLVVLSSPVVLQRLVDHFEDTRPAGLGLCSQLLGAEVEEVCWYRYNDSRQDGRLPPQQLQSRFPNLRLDGLEARTVGRLDELVTSWSERLGADQGRGGLAVRGGELLPVLRGATSLLPALSQVSWWSGVAEEAAPDLLAISELLAPHALSHKAAPAAGISLWERDEELYLRNALRQMADRVEALESARAALLEERDDLEARLERLEPLPAQLAQLDADHSALLQRQQTTASALQTSEQERLDSARQQEHQLHVAVRVVQAEAEQWRLRFEGCQGELKALGVQLTDLRQVLDAGVGDGAATTELKQQLLERLDASRLDAERYAAERDQLALERDRIAAERDQIEAERSTGVQILEDLQREKQALQEQMQQLADKVSRSESELETLKTMLLASASPTSAGELA